MQHAIIQQHLRNISLCMYPPAESSVLQFPCTLGCILRCLHIPGVKQCEARLDSCAKHAWGDASSTAKHNCTDECSQASIGHK
jgi:hypothetical protein